MGKFFLWLLVVVVLGYSIFFGIRWTKVRLDYSSIKSEAERLFSPTSSCPYPEIPDRLLRKAQEQKIPLREENIKIYVDDWEGIRVLNFEYVDSLLIFNYKTILFKFSFSDTVYYPGRK